MRQSASLSRRKLSVWLRLEVGCFALAGVMALIAGHCPAGVRSWLLVAMFLPISVGVYATWMVFKFARARPEPVVDRAISVDAGDHGASAIAVHNVRLWFMGDPRLGALVVYVDRRKVGAVLPGETKSFTGSPYDHVVRTRSRWFWSSPVRVDVSAASQVQLTADVPRGIRGFFWLLLRPLSGLVLAEGPHRPE